MTALRPAGARVAARCSLLVALTAPFLYFLLRQAASTGPTYLSDEITYLAYASHFAGRSIDAASGHHSGYGLFLAPAFVLFDQPQDIWRTVLAINAALWAATLLALRALLHSAAPKIGEWQRLLGLLAAALYPSTAIMAGYAFPTPAFSLVFVLATWALLLHLREGLSLGWHLACLALLYWIHPTAIGVVGASVIALAWAGLPTRQVRPAMIAAAWGAAVLLAHDHLLHPMIVQAMTPPGLAIDHSYPPGQSVMAAMLDTTLWLQFLTRFMGQISYALIGSFGLAAMCAWYVGRHVLTRRHRPGDDRTSDRDVGVMLLFLVGSLTLICALSALMFSYSGASRLDHWVYGRYVDAVLLPLIALACVQVRSIGASILACAWILVASLLLQPLTPDFGSHNLINTIALWPHYLAPDSDILTWFVIGAAGVGVLTFMPHLVTVVALAAALGFALSAQNRWQAETLATHSAPSDLVDIVRANYAPGTCIGFDQATVGDEDVFTLRRERYRLYTFRFLGYRYARMSAAQWQESCDGPLLTFQAPQHGEGKHATWRAVARERASGLLLLTRASDDLLVIPGHIHASRTTEVPGRFGQDCLIAGCFWMDGLALAPFARVGLVEPGALRTDFQSGYLFHGPYLPLQAGEYELTFDLDARLAEGAIVDVVSGRGSVTHYRAPLCPEGCSRAQAVRHTVELTEPVLDVEVRVFVSDRTDLSVRGYVLRLPPSPGALRRDGRMGES